MKFTRSALRRERKRQNMTQAELARRMNISRALVCQVEKGWQKPYPKFIREASRVLGLDFVTGQVA